MSVDVSKPVVLDLFCCEGGAAAGYKAAGFTVYGMDKEKRFAKRYPGDGFNPGDALQALRTLAEGGALIFGDRPLCAWDIDLIHMSPPCQAYTRGNAGRETSWPKLIGDCRELAQAVGLPYVIENVKDAGPEMVAPLTLCGCMFDLSTVDTDGITIHLQRPRLFETNWALRAPRECDHTDHEWVAGAYGGARRDKYEAKHVRKGGYVPPDKAVVKALLGVEHDMTWNGLFECIPPAYTRHIGQQFLEGR